MVQWSIKQGYKLISARLRKISTANEGFLLPVVIALSIGVSTVSVLAIQTVANNSVTLNKQHYGVIAREAAQAGIAHCNQLISASTSTLTNGDTTCASVGTVGVLNDTTNSVVSTYTLGNLVAYPTGSTTFLVTATGTVKVGGITVASEKAETFVGAGTPGSAGGTGSKYIMSISAGPETACVIANADADIDPVPTSGKAYCWGSNDNGLLGNDWNYGIYNRSRVAVPVIQGTQVQQDSAQNPCGGAFEPSCVSRTSAIPTNVNITKVSVGNDHACAVATDGKAYCWGENNYGQLGRRNTTDSQVPVAVDAATNSALTGKTVTDITAGNGFTCALTGDGLVACWGRNQYGQLGNDTRTNSNYPVSVSYATSSKQECVKWTNTGPFGSEECRENKTRPASPLISKQVKSLARIKNAWTMCVTDTNDAAYCWGQNFAGQLGDGEGVPPTEDGAEETTSGNENACPTIRRNAAEEIIEEFPRYDYSSSRPVTVASGVKFQQITIASNDDGSDPFESVDTGNATERTEFDQSTVYSYVTGIGSTTSGGASYAYYWGGTINFSGWVDCERNGSTYGNGNSSAEAELTRTYIGADAPSGLAYPQLSLASGNGFNGLFCGKQPTNQLICNRNGTDATKGQLGNGSNAQTNGSVNVDVTTSNLPSSAGIIAMDTGTSGYTCVVAQGIDLRNRTYCWGANSRGQLGDGTTTNRNKPIEVIANHSDSALVMTLPPTAGSPPAIIIRGF